MTKHEAAYLAAFLEDLSERLSNDGCTDMYLPNTPENRALVMMAAAAAGEENPLPPAHEHREIYSSRRLVLDCLQRLFMEEYGLATKGLPNV